MTAKRLSESRLLTAGALAIFLSILPGCGLFRDQVVTLMPEEVAALEQKHGPLAPATKEAWRVTATEFLGEEVKDVVDLPGEAPIVAILGSPAGAAAEGALDAAAAYVTENPGKIGAGLLIGVLGAIGLRLRRRSGLRSRGPPELPKPKPAEASK